VTTTFVVVSGSYVLSFSEVFELTLEFRTPVSCWKNSRQM